MLKLLNFDRCYWRSEPDSELVRAAKESGHELAIALGERLEDANDLFASVEDPLYRLRSVLPDLLDAIDADSPDFEGVEAALKFVQGLAPDLEKAIAQLREVL